MPLLGMPTARVSPAERCNPACKPRVDRSEKREKDARLKATDQRRQRGGHGRPTTRKSRNERMTGSRDERGKEIDVSAVKSIESV